MNYPWHFLLYTTYLAVFKKDTSLISKFSLAAAAFLPFLLILFGINYYYTGDKAFFDENGYWWFVGRADEVIKSSDYRIGPFEVESALLEHPAVAEAAVVGSPDPIRYQLVKAFVILKPGYEPSAELALELFEHCRKLLAGYKMPRIIEFVPELPKTISGKIKRKELRKLEEENKKKGIRGEHEYFYEELKKKK